MVRLENQLHRTLGAMILRGERQLTLAHVRTLVKRFLRVSRFVPPLTMNDVKESFFSAGAIRSTGAGGEGDFATVIRLSGNIRAETNMR